MGGRIVGFKGSARDRLVMAQFFESSDDRYCFLAVQEEASSFSFCSGSGNASNCFAENMDGSIGFRCRRIGSRLIAEEVQASAAAACIRKNKICGISDYVKNHVAGIVSDDGIGVGSQIVKE
jgi:hypothetical protein